MKKIILTVAAVFALSFANAQDKKEGSGEGFGKGDIYLTGTVNFMNEKQGDLKSDGLTIAPGIGYFLTENLALVGSLEYSSSKNTAEVKTTGFGLSAGVKYFWTPASKFSLSLGGQLSYMTEKEDAFDVKTNTIGLNVPVGLHYFVSDSFAITTEWAGLSYTSEKADTTGAEATNTIKLGGDLSTITLGLIYKL
ncbi:outer membrane beta-barrel protein [Flavobacterium phycosphaerae]|uniref:outer membrane beta-barrel protein n=1 Tax=Flavobacterium phycosphaerae TaxID=2697515 RepID=UPI00138A5822|nr:outer membrane beta-barrel protein [Flavobacterium phycosphaerae]